MRIILYTGLSVFDLDHTLLRVNSSYRFGAYLYRHHFFQTRPLACSLFYYARHKWLGMSIDLLHQKIFLCLFQGQSLDKINSYVQTFLNEELARLFYNPVIDCLENSKRMGHYTLILSSSPDFLVGPIAFRLGVHDYRASHYAVDSNKNLVNITSIIDGEQKAEYVKEIMKELKIPHSSVYAYSDSHLDLPVLEVAGKAIGVNPDKILKKFCLKNNWEIIG